MLTGLVGIVAPGAGARFQFGARIMPQRTRHAVVDLTGICGRAEIDEDMALRVDDERMHVVAAGQRQAGDDDLRIARGRDRIGIGRQHVADDLVVLLGIDGAVIVGDAGAAGRAFRHAGSEPLDHIGMADALEGHQKPARRRLVEVIETAAPGVDIEHAVRRDRHVADVADIVGEYGGAKSRRQREAAVIAGAAIGWRTLRLGKSRRSGDQQREQRCGGKSRSAKPQRCTQG